MKQRREEKETILVNIGLPYFRLPKRGHCRGKGGGEGSGSWRGGTVGSAGGGTCIRSTHWRWGTPCHGVWCKPRLQLQQSVSASQWDLLPRVGSRGLGGWDLATVAAREWTNHLQKQWTDQLGSRPVGALSELKHLL